MTSERSDLITKILRHEWGFKGMVLLKNLKNTLPIKSNVKNVAVFGTILI